MGAKECNSTGPGRLGGLHEMTSTCVHSAHWRPSWDDTTSHESLPYWVDGRYAALPSLRGARNASVGLCVLPKAASSRVKRYVFAALKTQGIAVGPDWRDCPHRQPLPPVTAPPSTAYVLVRHPLLRIASAWREVVRRGLWHRLPPPLGVPNVSFTIAVRALVQTPPMAINIHFRPLLHMCGLLHARRYKLLYYEDWNTTTSVLAAHFAPTLPRLQYRASGTLERAHGLYSRDLARAVNRWAEPDLTLASYAPWMPGESVRWGPSHSHLHNDRLLQRLP